MKRFLLKREVADRYRRSVHTIQSWVNHDYIPHLKMGRTILFDPLALDEWDKKHFVAGRAQLTPEISP